jgi:NADH-quinone oxidoreductase subunit N
VTVEIDTSQILSVFSTEAWLGLLALVLIAIDLVTGKGRLTGPADAVRLTAIGGLTLILVQTFMLEPVAADTFGSLDAFALFFKRFFVGCALLTLLLSAPYEARLPAGRGEFPAMVVFTAMGMSMLASVTDFVSLFVGLELVTVTLFLMAAWRPGLPRSIEAGIKFVVVGAIAAAFLVYGTAFVYGGTGSLNFADVSAALASTETLPGATRFGLLLILVGLGFKLGAVPFHVWIPDVYQGSPTPVTAFLSVGSKAAGVVLLMRLVYTVLGPTAAQWATVLAGLAALTLLMGNLGAITQTDLKRFLGYSGIAHAGYLLLALAVGTQDSASAILFYMVAYLFSNILAFLVIIIVSRTDDNSHMDRINGLADRSPFLAFALTVSMLSLAGVPPFSGFVGKFMILRAAMADPTLLPVVILGLAMVVVSLYYYLCVVKRMYFREAVDSSVLEVSGASKALLYVGIVVTFFLGIYMGPLVEAANVGAAALFQ